MRVYEVRDDTNNWIERAFFLTKKQAVAKAREWKVPPELILSYPLRMHRSETKRQDILACLTAVAHAHLSD